MSVSLVEKLTVEPVAASAARRPAAEGGAPARPGIYAWWLADKAALPSVPTPVHPTQPKLGLLYIGIAPNDDASAETIRSRLLTKHLGNALGSSTLRRALAALLWEDEGWHPHATPAGKPALPSEACAAKAPWRTCVRQPACSALSALCARRGTGQFELGQPRAGGERLSFVSARFLSFSSTLIASPTTSSGEVPLPRYSIENRLTSGGSAGPPSRS